MASKFLQQEEKQKLLSLNCKMLVTQSAVVTRSSVLGLRLVTQMSNSTWSKLQRWVHRPLPTLAVCTARFYLKHNMENTPAFNERQQSVLFERILADCSTAGFVEPKAVTGLAENLCNKIIVALAATDYLY